MLVDPAGVAVVEVGHLRRVELTAGEHLRRRYLPDPQARLDALIAELKPNVTPLTLPTGFGPAMDALVKDCKTLGQQMLNRIAGAAPLQ